MVSKLGDACVGFDSLGIPLRECPPTCGLLLYFATQNPQPAESCGVGVQEC